MNTKEIMALIERYRTAGGREEHHAYKEELERVLDEMCDDAERGSWLRKDNDVTVNDVVELSTALGDARFLAGRGLNSSEDVTEAYEIFRATVQDLVTDAKRYRWLRGAQTFLTEELFDIKVDAGLRGEE